MSYPFNQMPDHESTGVDQYGKRVVLKGSSIPLGQGIPTTKDGKMTTVINNVTVLAGAISSAAIQDYSKCDNIGWLVRSTQTYDIMFQPAETLTGSSVYELTVKAGNAASSGSNYNYHTAKQSTIDLSCVTYGRVRIKNTAASDATVTVREMIK